MTTDQHIASDPAISAIVSASAGSGKTKVLTDRVLRLLLGGAEPSRILCITYTKAASAEMEQRIEAQLGTWAIAAEEALRASLEALMGQPPAAKTLARARTLFACVMDAPVRIRILTIHAFCQSVLGRFPLEAGVAPHFTLIDDTASQALLQEARQKLLSGLDARGRQHEDATCFSAIARLTAIISETSFNELMEEIIAQRQQFLPWFQEGDDAEALYAQVFESFHTDRGCTDESLAQRYCQASAEHKAALKQAAAILAAFSAQKDQAMAQALQFWVREGDGSLQIQEENYLTAFLTQKGTPRKDPVTKKALEALGSHAQALLQEQERMVAFTSARQSLRLAQWTQDACILARGLLTLYRELKAQQGYLDYDDLILQTVQLFERSGMAQWVLYKLDGGIDHLLLDEAQDTSPQQWRLVEILAEEFFAGEGARSLKRTLFVVGDEKQSIYSFQGARPAAFDKMRQKLLRLTQTHGSVLQHVRLDRSFRSAAPVLEAVDNVFLQADARKGLVFSEHDIRHAVHRTGAAGRVELWELCEAPQELETEAWEAPATPTSQPSVQQLCAERIAATIEEWVRQKRILASQGRPVAAGDILILVQRRGSFAGAMLRALKQRGIPVAGADRMILSEHIAVMDCMVLGDFLLLPGDDLSLATVLKSPFIGMSEEDVFALAYGRGNQSLWSKLKADARFLQTYTFLSDLLAKTDYLTPYALYAYLLETLHGRRKLAARLGSEIEDPLNEFLALAMEYEAMHPPSLQGFLQWLRTGATQIKRDMEKSHDEVRIMTVHGAKGLQAPVVFLPDTTRTPRYDTGILWTEEGKPAVPLWTPFSDLSDRWYNTLKAQWKNAADEEYHRLLYVAMTRAEDELYICGWKGKKAITEGCWYELIRRGLDGALSEAVDGRRSMANTQTAVVKKGVGIPLSESTGIPRWGDEDAPTEPPAPRNITPSHAEPALARLPVMQDAYARQRGLLIHRLLQYLPDIAQEKREAAMAHFMARYGTALREAERVLVEREVLNILNHSGFRHVFGPGSAAEVSISGIVEDNAGNPVVVSGQIDRLAVQGDDVYVIDFKTNRTAPKTQETVPASYLAQMRAYHRLVSDIYPQKRVHCALIWTSVPSLMVLSPDLLHAKAA
jgi:ATP-dependent helicase/nuclease subunit A